MGQISPKLAKSLTPPFELATFAAGCFWGVEHIFNKYMGHGKGIIDTAVGYSGGDKSNPSYREVCTGNTHHAEALQVLFDPSKVSYEHLVDFFFRIHDPTQLNRQGPDLGTQYRSAVFTMNQTQQKNAEAVKQQFQKRYTDRIVTEVLPIVNWFDAEDYHQHYLVKNPEGYECPTHYLRS